MDSTVDLLLFEPVVEFGSQTFPPLDEVSHFEGVMVDPISEILMFDVIWVDLHSS